MATARKPRVTTRVRRTSARGDGPRAPMRLVELMQAKMINVVNAYIDRLMRVLEPELRARFAQDAADPVVEFATGQMAPGAGFLRGVFHMVDRQAAVDLDRVVGVPADSLLHNSHKLEQNWVRANTDLIKLPERARREVEQIISDPQRAGARVEVIRKAIEERLGVVRSRAELIARDQTLKLYGQIQQQRQTAAGIEEYVWSTSADERVRPDHLELDGTTQRWDSPPIVDKRTGRRGHPGSDFQCRCASLPILPDDAVAVEPELPPHDPAADAERDRLAEEHATREAERRVAEQRAEAERKLAAQARREADKAAERLAQERAAANAALLQEFERQQRNALLARKPPSNPVAKDFIVSAPQVAGLVSRVLGLLK